MKPIRPARSFKTGPIQRLTQSLSSGLNRRRKKRRARARRSAYESRLNRSSHPFRIRAVPIASVLLASMLPSFLPIISTMPLFPPFGLMLFLSWRLMRPGLWPIWAGLPFGLFDDIFSGQPMGSAAFIWSFAMLGMEMLDSRAIWRDHWQDWLLGGLIIILALLIGLWFVSLGHNSAGASVLLPQIILSVLLFPLVVRFCARLDGWRLAK